MLQFILIMLNAFRFLGLFCGWVCLTFAQIDSYSIFPVAGIARPTGDGGPAAAALLNQPRGVAVDAAGNTYFSDQQNHRVRKIDKSGIITTFAGTGIRGTAGDGGPAANAQLISPYGLAFGKAGDLYIADHDANIIRKVAADGTMSTIAGIAGLSGYSGDGGLSTTAKLNSPFDVAVDISGNLYIADAGNSRVRKVTPAGIITTAVGNGNLDFTEVQGPKSQLLFQKDSRSIQREIYTYPNGVTPEF
jgi:internalin A